MYVERDLSARFVEISKHYQVMALVGPRQAGKTTMLKHLMEGRNASYVFFDDPDAREIFNEDIKKFVIQYVGGYDLTVLDEVQYCEKSGIKLKYLADSGFKLWITSSSEVILSKEVISYLVGRVAILRLYPFNIREFLRAKRQKALSKGILKRYVWEHMVYGGFPAVVLSEGADIKKIILRNLNETMILKDVSRSFSIDNIAGIERLSRYLAANSGAMISYSKLADDLNISFQTLKRYLDALMKSYLIVFVPPFFTNKAREITKQPKIYFLDTGIRNSLKGNFPEEADGKLFENYVLSELVKMGYEPKYWRSKSKAEVDFVVEKEGKIIPIEVKLSPKGNKIERSMRSFIEKYNPDMAFVVYYTGDKSFTEIDGTEIYFTDILDLWNKLERI